MNVQSMIELSGGVRSTCSSRAAAKLGAFAIALLTCTTAAADSVPQFGVTVVNANGNALYDVSLKSDGKPYPNTGAVIDPSPPVPPTPVLNTDATSHGSFDAVVRAPNSHSNTVDLIVADGSSYQIVRYPGTNPPLYQTSTIIFDYKLLGKGSGPNKVTGLALDVAANLYAASVGVPNDSKPSLWVLPFNPTTGNYGPPALIDNTFGGVKGPGMGEVVVANVAASRVGTKPPAWNQGDLILLLNSGSGGASVLRYSQQAIAGVLACSTTPIPCPLTGPTSVLISSIPGQKPTGIDLWPADATHGVSLLLPTVSGLVMRFDSSTNAFTTNFASGLGSGLLKIKVGTYSTFPYAFVAQSTGGAGTGQILQFGAPPAGGSNTTPLSSTSGSAYYPVNNPQGLSVLNSGSVQVSACIAPQSCDPLGPQLTTQIEATLNNTNNPLLEQSCVVNADPRVTASVSGGTWSCTGGNLDVSTLCPGFPSTVLPGSLCGHSGPTGSGFVVVKSTAVGVDTDAGIVNSFIQNTVQPDLPLPGLLNLQCPRGQPPSPLVQVPIYVWAPRSDLNSVEGTIPEWTFTGGSNPTWTGPQTPYFVDGSGFCDNGGGNSRLLSMASYGLGLNVAGLPAGGLPQFVEDKFANLIQTITIASPPNVPTQINDHGTTLNYVNLANSYFNDGNGDPNDYDCALNTLATADAFVRANPGFFSGAAPPGNPNPAGDIDGRLANLYLTIDVDFLLQPANATWPPSSVPTCITLSSITLAPAATIPAGGTQQLTVTGSYSDSTSGPLPLDASVTWSSGDPTVATVTGGLVTCLSSAPPILKISVSPPSSMAGAAGTDSLTATGSYSYAPVRISAVVTTPAGPVQGTVSVTCLAPTPSKDLTTLATWASDTTSVATVSSGSVSCVQAGGAGITATYGGVMSPAASVTCPTPVLQSIAVTPQSPPEIEHGSLQLTATGRYSYGPTKNLTNGLVTWASSAPKVATVTAAGAVSCTTPPISWFDGVATISATLGAVTGSTKVTCDGLFSE
jgi:hypothetical protein